MLLRLCGATRRGGACVQVSSVMRRRSGSLSESSGPEYKKYKYDVCMLYVCMYVVFVLSV